VLDYFAGSGTTAHATVKLNEEDGGTRTYILVEEMGSTFHKVTIPRMEYVRKDFTTYETETVAPGGKKSC